MWESLDDISSNDARRKFVERLETAAPVFGPFMIAHQKEREEKEEQRLIKKKLSYLDSNAVVLNNY